jgi:hypothetical protein
MSITKRMKVTIARLTTTPSPAKVRAELRRDAKRSLMANWFYQGEGL